MFTLSPTLPLRLRFIFSSKSKAFVLRFLIGNDGLSMLLKLAPTLSSAVPCVFMRTPPGPKIFSAGPNSNFISEKENFSLPFAATFSASFLRKNSCMARLSLHRRYSSGVISTGVFRYESPILEPTKYRSSESSYITSCLMLSGIFKSSADESRSATSIGAVFFIFHRGCNNESGMASSSTISLGCALGAGFLAPVLSSCGMAIAPIPNRAVSI